MTHLHVDLHGYLLLDCLHDGLNQLPKNECGRLLTHLCHFPDRGKVDAGGIHGRGWTLNQMIVRVQVGDTIILVEQIEVLEELNVRSKAYASIFKLLQVIPSDAPTADGALSIFRDHILLSQIGCSGEEGTENGALDEFPLGDHLAKKVFSVTAPHLVEDQQD